MSSETYYEMLNLARDAAAEEISRTIDERYNKWRRLVTHHDPSIVAEAERSLRLLEQIRATLTDPVKRAAYDQGLETAGGLADPDALLRQATPAPPGTPPSARQSAAPEKRLDAWVCPSCQTVHAVGTRYCGVCGGAVGQSCPDCGQLIAAAEVFCSHCGSDIAVAAARQADETQQRQRREREAAAERELAASRARAAEASSRRTRMIVALVGIAVILAGSFYLLNRSQQASAARQADWDARRASSQATTDARSAEFDAAQDARASATAEALSAREALIGRTFPVRARSEYSPNRAEYYADVTGITFGDGFVDVAFDARGQESLIGPDNACLRSRRARGELTEIFLDQESSGHFAGTIRFRYDVRALATEDAIEFNYGCGPSFYDYVEIFDAQAVLGE